MIDIIIKATILVIVAMVLTFVIMIAKEEDDRNYIKSTKRKK